MDGQTITTSFIPKTRLTAPSSARRSFGLWPLISAVVLLVSAGLYTGVYFYKQSLQTSIADQIASLKRARESFEPSLISDLSRLNSSINNAKSAFVQHTAASKILDIISKLTLKDVRFSTFSYNLLGKTPSVSMNGAASSYTSVALQAKLFGDSDFIDQAAFSNLSLQEAGKVSFNVDLRFNPSAIIYKP